MYAIARSAFTLCTVIEAFDSVECRLTESTRSAGLFGNLGAPCDLLPSLAGWRSTYYAFTDIEYMDFNATECERSRRRRRAETAELQSVSSTLLSLIAQDVDAGMALVARAPRQGEKN